MRASPLLRCLIVIACTWIGGGATCIPRRTIPDFQPVAVFTSPPTVDQLVEVLNRSRNIQSLQSNSVSVNLNQEQTVNANLTWAREKRFRMNATVAGIAGVDIGSNDEAFWMTVRAGITREMYFARHAEFDAQPQRPVLPISPIWLVQALGVVDVSQPLAQPPISRPDGLVELTTLEPSPIGNYRRTLVVDPKYGFTRQVTLLDPTGRLVANAQQSKHEYYASIQTSLPHQVKVQLIPAGGQVMELDISISSYVVNGLPPDSQTQFAMPRMDTYKVINLAQLHQGVPQAITQHQVAPPQPDVPQISYRGVSWDGPLTR